MIAEIPFFDAWAISFISLILSVLICVSLIYVFVQVLCWIWEKGLLIKVITAVVALGLISLIKVPDIMSGK